MQLPGGRADVRDLARRRSRTSAYRAAASRVSGSCIETGDTQADEADRRGIRAPIRARDAGDPHADVGLQTFARALGELAARPPREVRRSIRRHPRLRRIRSTRRSPPRMRLPRKPGIRQARRQPGRQCATPPSPTRRRGRRRLRCARAPMSFPLGVGCSAPWPVAQQPLTSASPRKGAPAWPARPRQRVVRPPRRAHVFRPSVPLPRAAVPRFGDRPQPSAARPGAPAQRSACVCTAAQPSGTGSNAVRPRRCAPTAPVALVERKTASPRPPWSDGNAPRPAQRAWDRRQRIRNLLAVLRLSAAVISSGNGKI